MFTNWKDTDVCEISELVMPVCIKSRGGNVEFEENLLQAKKTCISFTADEIAGLSGDGAYIVLDFGKEVCGGIRLLTRFAQNGLTRLRITLGESLTEACSDLKQKNATNDHSPRDFTVVVSNMSDLTFGQSGFRFARIMVQGEGSVWLRNIYAVNRIPQFEKEGALVTNNPLLNQIIRTAAYTLKLTFQNGHIWDGIKRDRLIWCGDLNPEIITALYLFGDNQNIPNSLEFLRQDTAQGKWINDIPTYSAWWVLNLCEYCSMSGNWDFFRKHKDYAHACIEKMEQSVDKNGNMDFGKLDSDMPFYLDWPTFGTEDAVTGTAALFIYAAKAFLTLEDCKTAHVLIEKLQGYLYRPSSHKCTRAFQILAGRRAEGDADFLEAGGAKGISTFMAYYILKADVIAGGTNMLPIIKEYYGAMLSRGATTFWEDFDVDWLQGSGRIDEFPEAGEKDLHGDYGAYCYQGFRHSLCHGWSAGVLAFLYEYGLGIDLRNGVKAKANPIRMGVEELTAHIPVQEGWLRVQVQDGQTIDQKITVQI